MWWNFVARTPEEITQARTDWEGRRRFGEVTGLQRPSLERSKPHTICAAEPCQLAAQGRQHRSRSLIDDASGVMRSRVPHGSAVVQSGPAFSVA